MRRRDSTKENSRYPVISTNRCQMVYFDEEDILHLAISDQPEAGSVEINPNVTAELNDKGELIGIEILNAGAFVWYSTCDEH